MEPKYFSTVINSVYGTCTRDDDDFLNLYLKSVSETNNFYGSYIDSTFQLEGRTYDMLTRSVMSKERKEERDKKIHMVVIAQ